MSSPESPDKQDDPTGASPTENASRESVTEAVVKTTECPGCGRTFVGDYCPSCGQAAEPSTSITGVIGGFVRELVDVENGFWSTFVGLTLRPGKTLRRYLEGARVGLASPGRYLLASVLLLYFVGQGLIWIGFTKTPEAVVGAPFEGQESALELRVESFVRFFESFAQLTQAQWYLVVQYLLTVGLFALLLRRLFGRRLRRAAEALAVSAYVVGHFDILWAGVNLGSVSAVYLWTGQPLGAGIDNGSVAGTLIPSLGFFVLALYVGVAFYDFGGNWRAAVKGAVGVLLSIFEAGCCMAVLAGSYLLWRLRPFAGLQSPEGAYLLLGATGVGALVPLVLHAGIEAYYRLR